MSDWRYRIVLWLVSLQHHPRWRGPMSTRLDKLEDRMWWSREYKLWRSKR